MAKPTRPSGKSISHNFSWTNLRDRYTMRWSDLPLKPDDRTLRQFAGLWVLFFGGMACWQALFRGNATPAAVLGVLAVSIGPLGLVQPRMIRPIFVTWMV